MITSLVIGFALAAAGLASAVLKSWFDERRADRRKRRVIARVLIPDVVAIRCSMIGLGEPIKWDSIEFPQFQWTKYRDDLAKASTKSRDWQTISDVFAEVEELRQEAARYRWPAEMTDLDVSRLDDLHLNTRQALDVLHRYAGRSKPPRRVRHMRLKHRLRSLRLA